MAQNLLIEDLVVWKTLSHTKDPLTKGEEEERSCISLLSSGSNASLPGLYVADEGLGG